MGRPDTRRSNVKVDRLLLIVLIPGLIAGLLLGLGRYRAEMGNRAVELVLDFGEVQSLSAASGTPIPTILERFKSVGVTGVAINEDLIGDLVDAGRVTYSASESGLHTRLMAPPTVENRISDALHSRFGPQSQVWGPPYGIAGIGLNASPKTLDLMGVGLPPETVRLVKDAGLDVVARLQNDPAITRGAIAAGLSDLDAQGIKRVVCAGEEIIGFPGLLKYAAREIDSRELIYGSVEFAKQRGDAKMSRALGGNFVRVHSIPYAEMAGMTPKDAVERFARAVKERDIRLCYVRLPGTSGEAPLEDSLRFVLAIRRQIGAAGYQPGMARPFDKISRPPVLLALIALSVAAGAVLLLGSLISLSATWRYGLLLVGFAAYAGLALDGEMGRKLLALKAAIIFPTLGVSALLGPHFDRQSGSKSELRKTAAIFVGVCIITLFGALLIIGLLAERSYMVKVNQFVGIKAAHLLPILFLVFIMAAGLPILGKPFGRVWEEIGANLRKVVAHPLFVWHAIVVVLALGLIGFALLRTGNEAGVGVTGAELKFRAIMDRLMSVRPRTKEFMVGHPAMFLGIAFLLTRRRTWGFPLVALGMLGQVSLLNTFCHIHTPLVVSVLRAANGLALGLLLGIIAWLLLGRRIGIPRTECNS